MRAGRGVVVVPVVVKPVVVPLPPAIVPVEVANVEVAVRVAVAYKVPPVPPPLEYSQGCIAFGISSSRMSYWANALAPYTKYLHFL